MLPERAKAYFDTLWSARSAEAWSSLSSQQREFERDEFARGQSPNGAGFAARLSALYKESLSQRATAIAETLVKVHHDFDSPLDEDVDEQLREWGAAAFAKARDGLKDAYTRHLRGYGLQDAHPIGLEQAYALGQGTVASVPARRLWEQRNVPAMHPQRQAKEATVTITNNNFHNNINNSGTIGAVQTGPGAAANVHQQWVQGDTSELRSALSALRDAVQTAPDAPPEARSELVANIDSATAELQLDRPDASKLLGWLGGIGAVVETIANVQPAYEAVKALAQGLGISLP